MILIAFKCGYEIGQYNLKQRLQSYRYNIDYIIQGFDLIKDRFDGVNTIPMQFGFIRGFIHALNITTNTANEKSSKAVFLFCFYRKLFVLKMTKCFIPQKIIICF